MYMFDCTLYRDWRAWYTRFGELKTDPEAIVFQTDFVEVNGGHYSVNFYLETERNSFIYTYIQGVPKNMRLGIKTNIKQTN